MNLGGIKTAGLLIFLLGTAHSISEASPNPKPPRCSNLFFEQPQQRPDRTAEIERMEREAKAQAEAAEERRKAADIDFMARVLPKMLDELAEFGDSVVLQTRRLDVHGSTDISVTLPDTAETRASSAHSLFLLPTPDVVRRDFKQVVEVEYKGTIYKRTATFGQYGYADGLFTPSGNSSDKNIIWLKDVGIYAIGSDDYTALKVLALPD